jgi:hypothetical protein
MLNLTDLAYVFQNNQWYTAASQGWAIINAERINDSNWIVATAVNGSSQYAVLLTPR